MSRAKVLNEIPEDYSEDAANNSIEVDVEAQVADEEVFVEQAEQPQPDPVEPDVPEKYRNKSLSDIVQMHQEAEKLLGKQSSEVGELRGTVDRILQGQLEAQKAPETVQEDDTDFFVDPKTAVNRAIENHPKIREAERYSEEYRKASALQELHTAHPDMRSILSDPKFVEWIGASDFRAKLYRQADQGYDSAAANELLTLWKERMSVASQTEVVEKQARKNQVKAANTGSARGTGQGQRKKVYSRQRLIKLMETDPDGYTKILPDVFLAYQEGRIKP